MLGTIAIQDWRQAYEMGLATDKPPTMRHAREMGAVIRRRLMERVPGLEPFVDACKTAWRRRWIRAIDGRVVQCKTEYGVVNDVLQSDAGIAMKYALLDLDEGLRRDLGYEHGRDFAYMLNVHDEWQIETPLENAPALGARAVQAIRNAGKQLGVRCPLDGEFKVGKTWEDTH
jgi:DNA polymerase I-like protein with 3'-5' exonuclease and polymerase domains